MSAVAHAWLLGAHCRHSHAKVPRQCEADMSVKQSLIRRRLENWKHKDLAYQGYTYSLESNQLWKGFLLMCDNEIDPVSKYKNSTGVFACAWQMYLINWWSINTMSLMSASLRLCHVSQLNKTLFTNRAFLSSRPT